MHTPNMPAIGPGRWSAHTLASAQEAHARQPRVYRLYTERVPDVDLAPVVGRYFRGYAVYTGIGVYDGQTEPCTVIEIVATRADLQTLVHLAGDLRIVNRQASVLLSWHDAAMLTITEDGIR